MGVGNEGGNLWLLSASLGRLCGGERRRGSGSRFSSWCEVVLRRYVLKLPYAVIEGLQNEVSPHKFVGFRQ